MCGIVGYIGKNSDIKIGLDALKRLEYRGYDSAGLAVFDSTTKEIISVKTTGRINLLEKKIEESGLELIGSPFILHTRWATHGGVTDFNAHPHWDCKKNIYLVHNGIVENYKELKEELIAEGHIFNSETDTEVLSHLVEKFFKGNLEEALREALKYVRGSYAIVAISKEDPGKIVAAKVSSPLIIGVNGNEYLVASDPSAVVQFTRQVINLDDHEIAVLTPEKFFVIKEKVTEELTFTPEEAEKGGYEHFMLKEIMEQPESLRNTLRGRIILEDGTAKLGGIESVKDQLKQIKRLIIVACGTANFMSRVGEYMIEEFADIPVETDNASEFRYKKQPLDDRTAVLVISQSGETADTLAALKEAKQRGALTLGIVNVVGSSIARETDAGIYNHSGPEVAVASTKASTSQMAVLALLSLFLGRQRKMDEQAGKKFAKSIFEIPELTEATLKQASAIEKIAVKYKNFNNFYYIGRKYNFPIALEGALKLKEISYVHAEGIAGGELKHGPLALIDENFPTIAICPKDSVYEKMMSNIQEVKARKGPVIAIATEGDNDIKKIVDDVIYIPETLEALTPILCTVVLQLFAYYFALEKKCDIDKPKNLAKSVTVE